MIIGVVVFVLLVVIVLAALFGQISPLAALLAVLLLFGSGAWAFTQTQVAQVPQVVVTPTPVVVTPELAVVIAANTPVPVTASSSTAGQVAVPPGICGNTPGNEQGNHSTLVVKEGHLLNVEWYASGWSDHVRSILPPGTYTPIDGIKIGAWWDYQGCTLDYVTAQSGSDYDWTKGFTKS